MSENFAKNPEVWRFVRFRHHRQMLLRSSCRSRTATEMRRNFGESIAALQTGSAADAFRYRPYLTEGNVR